MGFIVGCSYRTPGTRLANHNWKMSKTSSATREPEPMFLLRNSFRLRSLFDRYGDPLTPYKHSSTARLNATFGTGFCESFTHMHRRFCLMPNSLKSVWNMLRYFSSSHRKIWQSSFAPASALRIMSFRNA